MKENKTLADSSSVNFPVTDKVLGFDVSTMPVVRLDGNGRYLFVLKTDVLLSDAVLDRLKTQMSEVVGALFPEDNWRVMVLEPGMELEVIRKEGSHGR